MAEALPAPPFRVEEALRRVEQVLEERTASEEPLLTRMARSVLFAGGKRMRPRILLLTFLACGGDRRNLTTAIEAAAAGELIHTATLVHDDIIDQSPLRRGRPTLHVAHGLGHAIVAADFLFTQGFSLSSRHDDEMVRLTTEACARLAEGEVREQRLAGDPDVTLEDYLDVIRRKTAEPIRAAALLGAHIAEADPKVRDELGEYGLEVGLAFQIADDLLDLAGDPADTGKPVLLDGKAGVLTLPALLALRGEERAAFLRDPDALVEVLRRPEILEATRAVAREHVEKALRHLEVVPPGPGRDELARIARSVVDRTK